MKYMNKPKIARTGIIIAVVILIIIALLPVPLRKDITLNGIFYNAGNTEHVLKGKLTISGWVKYYLFRADTFSGMLYIELDDGTIYGGRKSLYTLVPTNSGYQLVFVEERDGYGTNEFYWETDKFVNKSFTELLITDDEENVFAAPASTYSEANTIVDKFAN